MFVAGSAALRFPFGVTFAEAGPVVLPLVGTVLIALRSFEVVEIGRLVAGECLQTKYYIRIIQH